MAVDIVLDPQKITQSRFELAMKSAAPNYTHCTPGLAVRTATFQETAETPLTQQNQDCLAVPRRKMGGRYVE